MNASFKNLPRHAVNARKGVVVGKAAAQRRRSVCLRNSVCAEKRRISFKGEGESSS